jgi:hypothetical protein
MPGACKSDKSEKEACAPPEIGADTSQNPEATCDCALRPDNDAYCREGAAADSTACAQLSCDRAGQRPIETCCVLVGEPGLGPIPTLERTTDTDDYADPEGKPPDLSCFDDLPEPPDPDAPERLVTMRGVVEAFANGCDLVGVKIEVFEVQRSSDPETDGELGDLVGEAVVTDENDPIEEENVDTCTDNRKNRRYEYAGVPMDRELVIKTSAATENDAWAPLYTYNVYVHDGEEDFDEATMTYARELKALAAEDFSTIPTVAIGRTIARGNGAIGGEIHDCGNVRLQNARVDVTAPRISLSYFNDDQDNPLPKSDRVDIGTGRTALYSALDVKPGFVRVAATGLLDAPSGPRLVSLGYFDVRVFPDSVTSVSLRGVRPFQVKP